MPAARLEPFYASDYFDQIYEYAVRAHQKKARLRLRLTHRMKRRIPPQRQGKPFRNRSIAESLDLFTRMKNGEFPDGKCSLRAKIDVTAPNVGCATRYLPHPPRRPSSHRRQMVHLPDVRFRALPE